MTAILGISAFYHDSAAALVVDGQIVAAAQEERFTRKKHDHDFPSNAIEFCLGQAGLNPADLDYVGFYDKPVLTFERLLETYIAYAPRGFESFLAAMPVWLRQKLYLPREINKALGYAYRKRYVFTEHHQAHAASAFFPSPFEEAAILTLDGVGEWATASYGYGREGQITLTHEMRFPHSLGLLYSAFTYYCGFTVNSGEYKLMGLAPYGDPKYVDLILEHLVDLKPDGSLRLDMSYFNYCEGLTMTSKKFEALFGGAPRQPDTLLTERDMDIAASIQKVTEEVMLRAARHLHRETGMTNLCLAGGVALNCVGNGRILREGPFENVWIQPAAGDAGGSLGVALFIWHQLLGKPRDVSPRDSQNGSLLGPNYRDDQIRAYLDGVGAVYQTIDDDAELCEFVAGKMADGNVIGWFQGAMEFGPRALGARSIVGDPRNAEMQTVMNLKVKFRESFRPFAPAVLAERAHEYFDTRPHEESPYMLMVAPIHEKKRLPVDQELSTLRGIDKLAIRRSEIPAITHVDYSARIQTVDAQRNGLYHRLIKAFWEKTGCPVIVNTSFNLGWEPIVRTPQEAYRTFMTSEIDVLAIGHNVITKAQQPSYVTVHDNKPAAVLAGLWCCPSGDGGDLQERGDHLVCTRCSHQFRVEGGIPLLFHPHERFGAAGDVTEMVKSFYEETPFPNYNDHDSVRTLIEKSRRGVYANALNEALPFNSTILEVGCGTGQLTNFLGVSTRRAIGTDMCLNSLRLGENFRQQHGLGRVRFAQMNLFRPCFKPEQFDAVLCNGVLHHTADPVGGFRSLVPLVRPGGYMVIGLYNRYGRLFTDLRRGVFRMTGGRAQWLDPYLRSAQLGKDKRRAWFADQYRHPHESKHTTGEVLGWFEGAGLRFVRGVPSTVPGEQELTGSTLFQDAPAGSSWDHFRAQMKQVITGNQEGGFFLMIAQKPAVSHVQRKPTVETDEDYLAQARAN